MTSTLASPPFASRPTTTATPLPLWFLVTFFTLLLGALAVAKAAGALRIACCVTVLIIGMVLLRKSAQLYIQFTLWVWFLMPFVRRVIDERFGFADKNIVLLAPLLVSSLAVACLVDIGRSRRTILPFFLAICGVSYGLLIGLLLNPSAEVVYGFLNWVCPVLFGLFVYLKSPQYPQLRQAVQRTLLESVTLLGLYGIYQYISPPVWDVYWWQSLPFGLVAAFGRPSPYEVRVWSTMNAPQPFAAMMGMSLLLILSARPKLMVPVALIGLSAFSLTLVRTEWLGWSIGMLYLVSRLKPAVLMKAFVSGVIALLVLSPLLGVGPAQKMISERLDSFTHLAQDDSVGTRLAMYQHLTGDLIQNPFGHGVGNKDVYLGYSLDSGPLRMLYNFGLPGTFLYLAGAALALLLMLRGSSRDDIFALGCIAVLLSAFAKFLSLSAFMNASGMLVWLAVGMGLASRHKNLQEGRRSHATV